MTDVKFRMAAYDNGWNSRWAKVPRELNPYRLDSDTWKEWDRGWRDCDERKSRE